MSIILNRIALTTACAAALTCAPAPALGQVDRAIVMNILRECARIEDSAARMACYDGNVRMAGPSAAATPASRDRDALKRDVAIGILVECAKIGDYATRMACYDRNVRLAGTSVAAPASGQVPIPQGSDAPVVNHGISESERNGLATGQRAALQDNARTPEGFDSAAGQMRQITPVVASVSEPLPGEYLVTLEDGAQWEFTEDMPLSYRPPERGSTIEIERGAFGSFLLRFDQQRPVRVQRVR